MTALEFLKNFPFIPNSVEGRKVDKPSNSEIKRWLTNGAVIINGSVPLPTDEICFPLTELVFFPHGIRKTTIVKEK